MSLWSWGKRKWQEWTSWRHSYGQETDKENGQGYSSTQTEKERARGGAVGGDQLTRLNLSA